MRILVEAILEYAWRWLAEALLSVSRPLNLEWAVSLLKRMTTFSPDPDFLSDVAAFEAVVVALAIPLSFEIVSRISDRYESEVITRRFEREWENRLLPVFLVVNILLLVALRFFVKDDSTGGLWTGLAGLCLAAFIFVGITVLKFIRKLRRYVTDPGFLLDRFFDDARESLKE